ncbi:fungal hydrophobin [Paxillus involutus ATCC 200175]|nr:fungal hydrophobin [Paxillus involutus ATCC 200175]
MFIRASSIVFPIVALAAVAIAAPPAAQPQNAQPQNAQPQNTQPQNTQPKCNTGSPFCCDSTYTNDPTKLASLSKSLGIALPSVTGLIALTCTPITGLGTGTGAVCTEKPVCCTDNGYNGVVNLGCSPLDLDS